MFEVLIVVSAVAAIVGLLRLWLMLGFLWRVYQRGGAQDLKAAANAMRTAREPRAGFPGRQRKSD